MRRNERYAMWMLIGSFGLSAAWAGEASTSAGVRTGGLNGGNATATANYTGADGGVGLARTRTQQGRVNLARGLAIGLDRNGLDFSFSHAIGAQRGPAYAGTFNLSIGRNGEVSGSYGGVLSEGGAVRSAEASGITRSNWRGGTSTAIARGEALPTGRVTARTNSYNVPRYAYAPARSASPLRYWR